MLGSVSATLVLMLLMNKLCNICVFRKALGSQDLDKKISAVHFGEACLWTQVPDNSLSRPLLVLTGRRQRTTNGFSPRRLKRGAQRTATECAGRGRGERWGGAPRPFSPSSRPGSPSSGRTWTFSTTQSVWVFINYFFSLVTLPLA